MPTRTYQPSHYDTLSLPNPYSTTLAPTPSEIKLAYKRALLLHHPDKTSSPQKDSISNSHPSTNKPTIDDITSAYRTLISPSARAEYDKAILLSNDHDAKTRISGCPDRHLGLETVDLDDFSFSAKEGTYHLSCRCGKAKAYIVREEDLENCTDDGEISVVCEGCSLWIKVEFRVVDDDDDDDVDEQSVPTAVVDKEG